jgi:transcriptional regulator with XRE-family HTH domain
VVVLWEHRLPESAQDIVGGGNDQLAPGTALAHTPVHPATHYTLELMNEPTTLGPYLRREREHRGLTLRDISESTKVSVALLEGLETDDISRWPGGIFRRAFVRTYAECVGLNPDEIVSRFEQQHKPADAEPLVASLSAVPLQSAGAVGVTVDPTVRAALPPTRRGRLIATAADLTVAVVLALASAAAGSRLLWPVLLIAGYYAIGTLLTGTTPMTALLADQPGLKPADRPEEPAIAPPAAARPQVERRHQPRRTNERPRQRRGVQAGVRP